MKRTVSTLVAALLGALGVYASVSLTATANSGTPSTGQIGICHHTGESQAHEWVFITPDASGVVDGHGNLNHQFEGDIIPAFYYVVKQGQTETTYAYEGMNLDTQYDASLEPVVGGEGTFSGSVILANHCTFPSPGTTTTVTVPVTTTVHDTTTATTTVTTPAPPPVTVTTPAPPPVTVTTPAPPAETVTVTTPAPPPVTVTTPAPPAQTVTQTVQSPPKTITKTKTIVKTRTVVKWRTKLKVVHKCVGKPKKLPPTL